MHLSFNFILIKHTFKNFQSLCLNQLHIQNQYMCTTGLLNKLKNKVIHEKDTDKVNKF